VIIFATIVSSISLFIIGLFMASASWSVTTGGKQKSYPWVSWVFAAWFFLCSASLFWSAFQ